MKIKAAPFLSFILNGLGQIYNGQPKKGAVFILASLLAIAVIIYGCVLSYQCFLLNLKDALATSQLVWAMEVLGLGIFVACLISFLSMIDAYKIQKQNENQSKSNPRS